MSITITCAFSEPHQAQQAAMRLRRRGYTVSRPQSGPLDGNVLVAHPYGTAGGNSPDNRMMAALPLMAENGVLTGGESLVSVLTDDTQTDGARAILESLGGRIL